MEVIEHLTVAQVDYCQFGNSNPFRVKIKNTFNDVHDYFYVKKVDASRVYGLELEHILSPNRIFYIIDDDTIIEEHIMGIPGDMFIDDYLSQLKYQEVSLAKEFVKFNERCFVILIDFILKTFFRKLLVIHLCFGELSVEEVLLGNFKIALTE